MEETGDLIQLRLGNCLFLTGYYCIGRRLDQESSDVENRGVELETQDRAA